MAKRDSNIILNTTDDGEPAVRRRADAEESTDTEPINDESTTEQTDGVENPDGSRTISATPKEPSGNSTATNMPDNPLDAETRKFKAEHDHPEDWTDSELLAVAQQRRSPDLSDKEISERTGVARTVVGRALRKLRHATLTDTDEIRAEFRDRTPTQQTVIAAQLNGAPEYTAAELAEKAGCQRGTVGSTKTRYKPLIRQLDEVGLPKHQIPPSIRADLYESDNERATDGSNETDTNNASETKDTGDNTDATDETESKRETIESAPRTETITEPTTSTVTIEDARRFVKAYKAGAIPVTVRTVVPLLERFDKAVIVGRFLCIRDLDGVATAVTHQHHQAVTSIETTQSPRDSSPFSVGFA